MATATSGNYTVEAPVELDVEIPSVREYEDLADAELDERLIEAIEAAREAENTQLAELLSYELGSHYYRTR